MPHYARLAVDLSGMRGNADTVSDAHGVAQRLVLTGESPMTELLKSYYETQEHFRSEEVRNQYKNVREWSIAFNQALASLLARMDKVELLELLEHTTGMFRTVIAGYLRKFDDDIAVPEIKAGKKKSKSKRNSADGEIAATLLPVAKQAL